MAVFYKGAYIGSYWYLNDPRLAGLGAQAAHLIADTPRLMQHIARGTIHTPYVSLTCSFNIAWEYAFYFGGVRPTRHNPAYVYEVTLDPLPRGVTILEPVIEVADHYRHLLGGMPYRHDGSQRFVIGIASHNILPALSNRLLSLAYRQPPPATGTPRPPNLSIELETLVRALRDTEVLCLGTIPSVCITNRIDVYP